MTSPAWWHVRPYRVLMFAPAFAPFANAEAIVNSKLALAMLDAGWDVDIVSRNLVIGATYDYGSSWIEPWLPLREVVHEIKYPLGSQVSRYWDAIVTGLRIGYPLDGCRWAARAYRHGLALHARRPYDFVLSRAFPQYAHLPAMKFSHSTGTPWVANWNDPWDFLRQPNITGGLEVNIGRWNSFFAKKFAQAAHWHTFPSEQLRSVMTDYLNGNTKVKSSVIPHVELPGSFRVAAKKSAAQNQFMVTFCGRLWKYQDPTTFLQGFAQFVSMHPEDSSLCFNFVGIDDMSLPVLAARLGLSDKVRCHGVMGYQDVQDFAADSALLLAIDPPDTRGMLLTSKIVDYAQAGRPILALTTGGGALDNLLKNSGGGISVDYNSPAAIAAALSKFYASWRRGSLEADFPSSMLKKFFSTQTVMNEYGMIFKAIRVHG